MCLFFVIPNPKNPVMKSPETFLGFPSPYVVKENKSGAGSIRG